MFGQPLADVVPFMIGGEHAVPAARGDDDRGAGSRALGGKIDGE